MSIKRQLLSTTSPFSFNPAPLGMMIRRKVRSEKKNKFPTTGICISKYIQIPHLSQSAISKIDTDEVKIITRHFDKKYADITLDGSYKFGTIAKYRPADRAQIGRFSDVQEGLQREIYENAAGSYNFCIDGSTFKNIGIHGLDHPIAIEFNVNDFCSCASIGHFSEKRAKLIRDRGNPDINAYAVYDLKILRDTIQIILSENEGMNNLKLIARKVEYGEKDRHWDAVDGMTIQSNRDNLEIWLKTAFVKSNDYLHEEEVRILAINPSNVGRLNQQSEPMIINDPRIRNAIIDYGYF